MGLEADGVPPCPRCGEAEFYPWSPLCGQCGHSAFWHSWLHPHRCLCLNADPCDCIGYRLTLWERSRRAVRALRDAWEGYRSLTERRALERAERARSDFEAWLHAGREE